MVGMVVGKVEGNGDSVEMGVWEWWEWWWVR